MGKQHEYQPRMTRRRFLIQWIIGHALSWLGVIGLAVGVHSFAALFRIAIETISFDWVFGLIFALGMGGLSAFVQKRAIGLMFGQYITGWRRWTIAMWLLSTFLIIQTKDLYPAGIGEAQVAAMQGIILFSIPALAQAWLLRKHVRSTWLWVLASIAGAATFGLFEAMYDNVLVSFPVGYGAYAVVTGLSLLWLFGMTSGKTQQQRNSSRLTTDTYDSADNYDDWYDENDDQQPKHFIQG